MLEAARSLASEQDRTLSEVVSDLARKGLEPELSGATRAGSLRFPRSGPTFR